jgi:hypothetical protein
MKHPDTDARPHTISVQRDNVPPFVIPSLLYLNRFGESGLVSPAIANAPPSCQGPFCVLQHFRSWLAGANEEDPHMPTMLRVASFQRREADFSPLLGIVAALIALVLVFAEAKAMGGTEWDPFPPPDVTMISPV